MIIRKKDLLKNPKCWKCGKLGHYKNNCKLKDNIDSLEISDDLKLQLYNLLKEHSGTEFDTQSTEDINEIEQDDISETSTSSSSSDSESEQEEASPIKNCTSSTCCNKSPEKSLMPLPREERQLLDFVDTITDQDLKRTYLQNLSNTIAQSFKANNDLSSSYSLKSILNRFNKTKTRPTTIQDLQHEINRGKTEIKYLKEQVNSLEQLRTQVEDLQRKQNYLAQQLISSITLPENIPEEDIASKQIQDLDAMQIATLIDYKKMANRY
ncbi:hypothetical protein L1049_017233 [Liquidambar formosana]|uniref:CCHC-type domain-containing protein n=1 Tax=Liquidambar formosana TaxID=63359 RepID=A0AAP0S7S4_LIQFO